MPKKRQMDELNKKSHSYYNFENYQLKIWRKLLHISSAWIGFVYIYSNIKTDTAEYSLICASLLLVVMDLLRIYNKSFKLFITKIFKKLFIDRDNGRLNSATWYIISAAIGMILFGNDKNRLIAGLPILYLAFGDTAASILGKKFGRKKIPILRGTWIGTLSCFITCFIINLFYLNLTVSIITAAAASIAEALPIPIDDNISMVLISATVLSILT